LFASVVTDYYKPVFLVHLRQNRYLDDKPKPYIWSLSDFIYIVTITSV